MCRISDHLLVLYCVCTSLMDVLSLLMQGKPQRGGLKKDPAVYQWVPVEYDIWREEVAKEEAAKWDAGAAAEQGQPPPPSIPHEGGSSQAAAGPTQEVPSQVNAKPADAKPPAKPAEDPMERAQRIVGPFAAEGNKMSYVLQFTASRCPH